MVGAQPDNSVDPILDALRSAIAPDGRREPERVLAQRLGVTRHRLRSALKTLQSRGEIAPAPPRRGGLGLRDREAMIRATNPLEVIELRIALEPSLARLAALRATPFDIARIGRAATTPVAKDSGAADLAFHRLVATSTRNSLAAEFYALLRRVGTDVRLRLNPDRPACPNRLRERDAEHRAIATAIAARDPDAAEQAMRHHLNAVQEQILGRLMPRQGAA